MPDAPWSREIHLQRVLNVRDLGGYPTVDGRQIRRGVLFRSGELAALSANDKVVLAGLGLITIHDMRTNRERMSRPAVAMPGVHAERFFRDHDRSRAALADEARRSTTTDIVQGMIQAYRRLPYEQADSVAAIFGSIAEGRIPLLFHCVAGKDRTGLVAALLLEILGVSRPMIIEDYLLTNRFADRLMRRFLVHAGIEQHNAPQWEPLIRADPVYLEAMFAELASPHGDARGYLHQICAIDDRTIAQITSRLLEQVQVPSPVPAVSGRTSLPE